MKRSLSLSLALLVFLAFLSSGCSKKSSIETNLSPENWSEGELEKYIKLNQTYDQPHPLAEGSKGMVVGTTGALAVRAGLEALMQGGSAVDAAMTTALAQVSLASGCWVSYAGFMTMVYYDADTGKVHSMNAAYNTVQEEKEPLSIPFMGRPSGRATLVPGFMAGVQAAHDRFGKLPFAKLFEPAIYFAEKGFEIDARFARLINRRKNVLTRLPETKKLFTNESGKLYTEGNPFRQPQLAETLKKVADMGADYMYKGEWAKKFVDAVRQEGGKITLKDMEDYEVIWSEPIKTNYSDYDVFTVGFPNIGGMNTIQALNMLEAADLPSFGHYTTSSEALYWFIQISRVGSLSDPQMTGIGFSEELLKKYIPEGDFSLQSRIKKETAKLLWKSMQEPNWSHMMKEAYEIRKKAFAAAVNSLKSSKKSPDHSDSVVAVDEEGNVAALVHTINGGLWGTLGLLVDGVSVPDSGSFQQQLINRVGPGARLPDPTNPLIVFRNGKPFLGAGSIGVGLHEATLQGLVNILDFGMDPKTAVDTANFMCPDVTPSEYKKQVIVEGKFLEDILHGVQEMGQELKQVPKERQSATRGIWIVIKIDPKTGKLQGGIPPHILNGHAEGY